MPLQAWNIALVPLACPARPQCHESRRPPQRLTMQEDTSELALVLAQKKESEGRLSSNAPLQAFPES